METVSGLHLIGDKGAVVFAEAFLAGRAVLQFRIGETNGACLGWPDLSKSIRILPVN